VFNFLGTKQKKDSTQNVDKLNQMGEVISPGNEFYLLVDETFRQKLLNMRTASTALEQQLEMLKKISNQNNMLALDVTINAAEAEALNAKVYGEQLNKISQDIKELAKLTANLSADMMSQVHDIHHGCLEINELMTETHLKARKANVEDIQ
jgi:hypothetical protein